MSFLLGVLLSTLFLCNISQAGDDLFYQKHESEKSMENLLFIHGTPGDHKAFQIYLDNPRLKEKFNMISVDRLGFGKSQRKVERSLEKQNSAILKITRKEFKNQKVTCVGHSYGGPLCLKLSIEHPEIFHKAVLIAGVFNPYRKLTKWYNVAASIGIVKWFLPRNLINSNKEMYGLKSELLELEKLLPSLKSSILIIHGKKDRIVPFGDSLWLANKIQKDRFKFLKLEDIGHFVLWKKSDLVTEKLINF